MGGNWWPAFVCTRRHWSLERARPFLTCRTASPTGAPLYLPYHQALSYARRFNWFSRSPDTKRATSPRVFGDATHRLIMDYTDVPNFALLRHGTVIVRLKMEVTSSCCQSQVHPVKGCSNVVHRLSSCEQCIRTRLNKKYSDCDSELVDYRLPYKTRTAKSKHLICYYFYVFLLFVLFRNI